MTGQGTSKGNGAAERMKLESPGSALARVKREEK